MRKKVADLVLAAEKETRVTLQEPKRTLDQNAKLHAMATDISKQHEHAGRLLTVREWKILFLHYLNQEVQFLPSIDKTTFVPIGRSTADLGVKECSDLIEAMYAKGAEWGIVWREPELRGDEK